MIRILAFKALFDLFAGLQLIHGVLADGRVCLRMDEIRERIEHLVIGTALLEFLLDDVEIAQPGHARRGDNHCLGASADEGLHVLFEDPEHNLGLVLIRPSSWKATFWSALATMGVRPPESQYCVFRSGRERFCLPVLDVEEVVEWPLITRLPLSPAYVLGIFNLRGAIVPLIDIALTEGRRTGLLPKHVVVASLHAEGHRDEIRIGIAADEVVGTYSVARCGGFVGASSGKRASLHRHVAARRQAGARD